MPDLPKRGDRVRVTWAHQHSSLKAGSEVVLSSHGYAVDPANELYRPTPPPDCVAFMYADADHRERGSHAVKVEILERAGATFTLTCRKCGRSMQLVRRMLGASQDTTVDECALCEEERASVHPEFARGMRRAVEIAEDLGFGAYGNRSIAYVDELKEAVEKELEVVTTPAPPLTVAELDSMSNMRANLWPFGWVNRVIAQARRALTLESELAQLRSGLYRDSLTDAQVAELQRDIELDVGAWDAVGLRQALLRELQRMRGAMPDLIRRSNELPGLSAAHDEAQHELAQLRREKAEREELEKRLVAWLRDDSVDKWRSVERQSLPDGVETVSLSWETPDADLAERTGQPGAAVGSFVQADGPTCEAALAAALEKLGKP